MVGAIVSRYHPNAIRPAATGTAVASRPGRRRRAFTPRSVAEGVRGGASRRLDPVLRPRGYTRCMCGRFTLTPETTERIAEILGIAPDEVFEETYVPRWNVAPMQPHWIVRLEGEERCVLPATWGLVNWWETSRREGAKHINARAETLATRRTFHEAFAATRCIVPADGFFEWVGDAQARRPFWFHRPDREPFAFAGLYAEARLKGEPEAIRTFTIVTTRANELMEPIHNRMPVILDGAAAIDAWLDPRQRSDAVAPLLEPIPRGYLEVTAVSTRVNSVANDDPACLDEAEPETQAPLL